MYEHSTMYAWDQMEKNKGMDTLSGAPGIEKNLKGIQKLTLETLRLNLKSQCHLILVTET